jgi:hypothetical protein
LQLAKINLIGPESHDGSRPIATQRDEQMRKIVLSLVLVSFIPIAHAAGIGDVFGTLLGRSGAFESETGVDNVLVKLSSQMNQKLPMAVDSETRLDKVSAVPGRHFIYHYTLIALNSNEISSDNFHQIVRPQLKKRLCASSEMRSFLKNGVTISYLYQGKDGQPIGGAKFTPGECGYEG